MELCDRWLVGCDQRQERTVHILMHDGGWEREIAWQPEVNWDCEKMETRLRIVTYPYMKWVAGHPHGMKVSDPPTKERGGMKSGIWSYCWHYFQW